MHCVQLLNYKENNSKFDKSSINCSRLGHVSLLNYRFILRFEPWSDVNVRVVGHEVNEGHDGHQPEHQVDCDPGLVDRPRLLPGIIPRDEITQTHGGQRDEAVVEGVKQGPDWLHDVQQDGGYQDKQEENNTAHQSEMKNPRRRKINRILRNIEDRMLLL